jgi:hypothetical protein
MKELSIDDDGSDEDRHDAAPASETEKQRILNTEATLALLTDSLLPASVFSYDNQAKAITTVRSHPSFDIGALLPTSENNESDTIRENTRLEKTLAEHCVDDKKFLSSSKYHQDFRRYCPAMPPSVTCFPH